MAGAEQGTDRSFGMSNLRPFQKATVTAVLNAFKRKCGSRRFLVADEVGLGKTVVAQHVIKRLMKGRRKPLVVFYLCSSLAIASQNRRKLLEVLPTKEDRAAADCPVDRLSLLKVAAQPNSPTLHLYSFTPDTSIPIRTRHRRDGRQEERALIHELVRRIWPALFKIWGTKVFRGSIRSAATWAAAKKLQRPHVRSAGFRRAFVRSVREEFGLEDRQKLLPVLQRKHENGLSKLELIAHFRNALAASAIEEIAPDLVIFDEFQKFRDLLEKQKNASARRVIGRLTGDQVENPPALLLLSATPYRLFSTSVEEASGKSHRSEFFQLITFLYGEDDDARRTLALKEAFATLETALRKNDQATTDVLTAKETVENLLRPVMARTERFACASAPHDDFRTVPLDAPLDSDDLVVFKHLHSSLNIDHVATAVPYWTSIPLPMQSMGNHYIAWKTREPANPHGVPELTVEMRDRLQTLKQWPHPRLRALRKMLPPEQLAIPWLSPTSPWWPLRGAWKDKEMLPKKILIFSRFRAVPQTIAAAISFDLESQYLARKKLPYSEVTRRRLFAAKANRHTLLAVFGPSPFLINATRNLSFIDSDVTSIRKSVRRELKKSLEQIGIAISETAPAIVPWRLLARLEGLEHNWEWMKNSWLLLGKQETTDESPDSAFNQLIADWTTESQLSVKSIRPQELDSLTTLAIGAPGVVIGRALQRHWDNAVSKDGFSKTLAVSWSGFRNYMDQRWFYSRLRKPDEKYTSTLLRVTIDGNLEGVLDEHLWIISKLRSTDGSELADELRKGFTLRNGQFHLHPLQNDGTEGAEFSLRCHVAMPFVQTRAAGPGDKTQEKPIRADELRRAFNSPFWPYVLATTSVGQEGLDFHVWCDTLIHWDLCHNPVDLEQREGRIQRFGGLAIRQAIADQVSIPPGSPASTTESPWFRIADIADKEMSDESGLSPWWICKNGNVQRYVFDVPTSEQSHWLEWVKNQRFLYRLVLGQPNQEDMLQLISERFKPDDLAIRNATVNLSPFSLLNKS